MCAFGRMRPHVCDADVLLPNSVYFRSFRCVFITEYYYCRFHLADCEYIFYQIYQQVLEKDLPKNAIGDSMSIIFGISVIFKQNYPDHCRRHHEIIRYLHNDNTRSISAIDI